jgi:hypothetical protein
MFIMIFIILHVQPVSIALSLCHDAQPGAGARYPSDCSPLGVALAADGSRAPAWRTGAATVFINLESMLI